MRDKPHTQGASGISLCSFIDDGERTGRSTRSAGRKAAILAALQNAQRAIWSAATECEGRARRRRFGARGARGGSGRKGEWYHVWCKYRDRSRDRIRDCFIAPVVYGPDGSMHDDLDGLGGD